MLTLGKIVWAGQVWLTALMTLIAGLPHFDCLCPDGHRKPFCLAIVTQGDCCCRSHTHTRPAHFRRHSCCGKASHKGKSGLPGNPYQFERAGCTKTLAQAPIFALSHLKPSISRDSTPAPLLLPAADLLSSLGVIPCGRTSWQAHPAAPPPDLVTVFQHLLI